MAMQLIGYVLALLLGVLAIYFWRKTGSLYTLLVEGAGRYEDLRRQYGELEQTLSELRSREGTFAARERQLEQEVSEAKRRAVEFSKQLDLRAQQEQVRLDKLELQKNHLERELDKLRGAGEQFDGERVRLTEEAQKWQQTVSRFEAEKLAPLRDKLAKLETELRNAQKEKQDLEKRLVGADPLETKRMKRKVAHYARLYASMKGLREMTDERNRNWEVALRKLSLWVVAKHSSGRKRDDLSDQAPIGPIVGEAMAMIGEQLVNEADFERPREDDEGRELHDGANGSESMVAEEGRVAAAERV